MTGSAAVCAITTDSVAAAAVAGADDLDADADADAEAEAEPAVVADPGAELETGLAMTATLLV